MGRNRLVLGFIFLLLYVPLVLDHGFLAGSRRNIDLPSFHYAAEAAFGQRVSPYDPAARQELARELEQVVFPFLYPPPSLLLLVPLAGLSYPAARTAVLVVNHLALLALLYLLLWRVVAPDRPRRDGDDDTRLFGLLTLPLLLLYVLRFHPVVVTLNHGQINLVVTVLLVLFWIGLREDRPPALTALPLAGAILLKTYPALFLPLLVIQRRWRPAAWAAGYTAALAALSWVVLPRQAWHDWFAFVLPSGGYANTPADALSPAMPWNQGLNGFMARLFLHPTYAAVPNEALARGLTWALALLLVAALVWLSVRLARRRETRCLNDEIALVLLTMFLVAPLSWEHHLVFVLPAILLALARLVEAPLAWRTIVPVGLAAGVLAWRLDFLFDIQTTGPQALLVSLKFYAVVVLWAYFAHRLWRAGRGAKENP